MKCMAFSSGLGVRKISLGKATDFVGRGLDPGGSIRAGAMLFVLEGCYSDRINNGVGAERKSGSLICCVESGGDAIAGFLCGGSFLGCCFGTVEALSLATTALLVSDDWWNWRYYWWGGIWSHYPRKCAAGTLYWSEGKSHPRKWGKVHHRNWDRDERRRYSYWLCWKRGEARGTVGVGFGVGWALMAVAKMLASWLSAPIWLSLARKSGEAGDGCCRAFTRSRTAATTRSVESGSAGVLGSGAKLGGTVDVLVGIRVGSTSMTVTKMLTSCSSAVSWLSPRVEGFSWTRTGALRGTRGAHGRRRISVVLFRW